VVFVFTVVEQFFGTKNDARSSLVVPRESFGSTRNQTLFVCLTYIFFSAFFQFVRFFNSKKNLSGGKLGHRLGAFRNRVLGQFTGQDQTNGRLDFSGGHGRLFVVPGQLGGFRRDLFEDVVDEGVHDAHRLGGDAGVRVHLLQDFVDVDLVGFDLLLGGLLGAAFDGLFRWFLAGHRVVRSFVCVQSNDELGKSFFGKLSKSY